MTRSLNRGVPPAVGDSFGAIAGLGGIGPEYTFAKRAVKATAALELFAVQARSIAIRDAFARAATRMQYNLADLLRISRAVVGGHLSEPEVSTAWLPSPLLALARTMANQRLLAGDLEDALVLFKVAELLFGRKALGKPEHYLIAELLGELGRYGEASKVLNWSRLAESDPVHTRFLLANARVDAPEPDWLAWLETVNEAYTEEGLSPISLDPRSGRTPFDSLGTVQEPRTVIGPLVTVIIPTYNRGRLIETTLKCLLNQSWRNLEIIVVDDASEEPHRSQLEDLCEPFPEVTVLHQPHNSGAYPARNLGVEASHGEFITVHDDDDWSHGQKIELQALHLVSNSEISANLTRQVRMTEGLVAARINNIYSLAQPNYSSLMCRREVFQQVGLWDAVNRGADSEFRHRIIAASGQEVSLAHEVPLSFTRIHEDSLTSGEISRGYVDPSRMLYQAAYMRAHEGTKTNAEWRSLEFVKPLNMQPGRRGSDLGFFDVVYVTDFRLTDGSSLSAIREIRAAADEGLRVGVVNVPSPVSGTATRLLADVLDVAQHPNVEILSLLDSADASLVIVRQPVAMQFIEPRACGLRTSNVIVTINQSPFANMGQGYMYDFDVVRSNAERVFGVSPVLMVETEFVREASSGLVRLNGLSTHTWSSFIDDEVFESRTPDFGARPVLGRHSSDEAGDWPTELGVIRDAYGPDHAYRVRVLGGLSSAGRAAERVVAKQGEVIAAGQQSTRDFLDSLDFWASYRATGAKCTVERPVLEALAAGLIVVLPRSMESEFRTAAVYAEPDQLDRIVQEYWSDPERYAAQSAAAVHAVETRYSRDVFLKRLKSYMVQDHAS